MATSASYRQRAFEVIRNRVLGRKRQRDEDGRRARVRAFDGSLRLLATVVVELLRIPFAFPGVDTVWAVRAVAVIAHRGRGQAVEGRREGAMVRHASAPDARRDVRLEWLEVELADVGEGGDGRRA